ncbi:MAG TPA: GNAT family N-acetyltransferase [Polyangiaceae bacterium]|nr:GNAT family N-acetyltransferase [Polyangiaceae bacterium]
MTNLISNNAGPLLETERLILRPPMVGDLDFLLGMNQDPIVMEFMPGLMSEDDTRRQLERMIQHFAEHGFGTWIAVLRAADTAVGAVGLKHVDLDVAFAPAVEIAWRLARANWGHGYATEAARQVMRFGFQQLHLERIVGFTVPRNQRSLAVFGRLGMEHDTSFDFEHPKLPPGHPLRSHVFYQMDRAQAPRLSLISGLKLVCSEVEQ